MQFSGARRVMGNPVQFTCRRTARARTARARTAGTRNASMGSASAHNASMHSASTKHGPAHPRDVDDVDGRRPHDVDERYTHHTPSTKAHSPSTHSTGTRSRQGPERAHIDDKPHEHAVHSSLAAVGPPPGRRVRCAAQPLMQALYLQHGTKFLPRRKFSYHTVDCDRNRRARLLKKQLVQTLYDFSNQIVPRACFPDGIRVSNLLGVQID